MVRSYEISWALRLKNPGKKLEIESYSHLLCLFTILDIFLMLTTATALVGFRAPEQQISQVISNHF
jgi:hypothetical protein